MRSFWASFRGHKSTYVWKVSSDDCIHVVSANSDVTEMHRPGQQCNDLIEMTANALSENVVAIMLLAVQKGNLELSIKMAVRR
jgi:hypothetical protein